MVCPYNNLCQEFGKQNITAITFDKLFGLVLSTDDSQKFSVKKFDIDEYNTIVFDEVFLHTPKKLKMINQFIIENPNKYIIATGDLAPLTARRHASNKNTHTSSASLYWNYHQISPVILLGVAAFFPLIHHLGPALSKQEAPQPPSSF